MLRINMLVEHIRYLGYYIYSTDYTSLKQSIKAVRATGRLRLPIMMDMLFCSLRYGSSFEDYFNFRFYEKVHDARSQYATMGFMYRFHAWANAPQDAAQLDNKQSFGRHFASFCHASYSFPPDRIADLREFLDRYPPGTLVVKDPFSTAGRGVRFVSVMDDLDSGRRVGGQTVDDFIRRECRPPHGLYIEPLIRQHSALDQVSPSGVNTLRVITMVRADGQPDIIGAIFRISVNSSLDNFSKGNLAAEVDIKTGIVTTGGICKQAACDVYHDHHPVTGVRIRGLVIPFWRQTRDLVCRAAMLLPRVRTVGWDVAISADGPLLIEGNSKWGKDAWQITAGYGKKARLLEYY